MSSDLVRYKRAKDARALARTSVHKGQHCKEMAKISSQYTNETDFDSIDKEELEQVEACVAKLLKD